MDFEKLANDFIKQHEGVGYQSQPQMVAVRAFAKWLSENASQHRVQSDGAILSPIERDWSGDVEDEAWAYLQQSPRR